MANLPPLLPTNKDEEEDEYKKTYEKYNQLIESLPKAKGWRQEHIFNYNGFWLGSGGIKGNLLLNTHFKSQPTDIFLAAFMKSGTTWLKALMFAIVNRHRYTFSDHPLLRSGPQATFPFIDAYIYKDYPIADLSDLPSPRLFATHFARSLLPPSVTACKFVYVCRDPKDVLISKWHFMRKLRAKELPPLSLDEAYEMFIKGESEYGPFWDHVLEYWKASLECKEKILFLKYEEMKKEPAVHVKRLAEFMGQPFTAEEEEEKAGVVEEIVKLCSFENLSNLEVNKKGAVKFGNLVEVENREFFRKGEIGDWKNHLSEEMKQVIDGITDEKLKGSGLVLGSSPAPPTCS